MPGGHVTSHAQAQRRGKLGTVHRHMFMYTRPKTASPILIGTSILNPATKASSRKNYRPGWPGAMGTNLCPRERFTWHQFTMQKVPSCTWQRASIHTMRAFGRSGPRTPGPSPIVKQMQAGTLAHQCGNHSRPHIAHAEWWLEWLGRSQAKAIEMKVTITAFDVPSPNSEAKIQAKRNNSAQYGYWFGYADRI